MYSTICRSTKYFLNANFEKEAIDWTNWKISEDCGSNLDEAGESSLSGRW